MTDDAADETADEEAVDEFEQMANAAEWLIPGGARYVGMAAAVSYIDSDGEQQYAFRFHDSDLDTPTVVGMLEIMKHDVMMSRHVGPGDPHWRDD